MRGNPFLSFHRAAEAAGCPVLLLVSAFCLALVVAPVALLGVTEAGWALALAVLSLVVALAVLAGAVDAALSDGEEPLEGGKSSHETGGGAGALHEGARITALPRGERTIRQAEREHRAA
jgi:hypothetical protein